MGKSNVSVGHVNFWKFATDIIHAVEYISLECKTQVTNLLPKLYIHHCLKNLSEFFERL